MDFSFNEEQQMLLDTTRRFIAERYGFEHRNTVLASQDGWSREVWTQLGELGLLAINIPEEEGGWWSLSCPAPWWPRRLS